MSNRLPRNEQEDTTPPPVSIPFVLLPVPQIEGATPLSIQQQLYQMALQQVQQQQAEAQRPVRYETDWLNSSN